MSTERILITGGAGFIGSHLAQRLVQDNHSVIVLDNLLPQVHGSSPKPDLPGCETIWADVRDAQAVNQAMRGVDVVYHLAAETGVGQSQYEISRYVSVNTHGTAVVLEAALAAGVQQVVIASSRAVYGEGLFQCSECGQTFMARGRRASDMDRGIWEITCPSCSQPARPLPTSEDNFPAPSSIYGLTKLHQEQLGYSLSAARELPITILRFFNVYGPGQSLSNPYVGVLGTFFRRARSRFSLEVYEDGKMLRDFVFIEDVVDVLRRVIGNDRVFGRSLNVGTGKATTLLQVAREICNALSVETPITVSGRYRLGDVRHAIASVSLLEGVLGISLKTTFVEGLRAFVNWALEHECEAADDLADEQLTARQLLRQARP